LPLRRRDDDVDLEPDEIGDEILEGIPFPGRRAELEDDAPALRVAELTQRLPENVPLVRARCEWAAWQNPDPGNRSRWLRFGGKRHGEEAEHEEDEDHRAPEHHP
jgi:hypothetical protein